MPCVYRAEAWRGFMAEKGSATLMEAQRPERKHIEDSEAEADDQTLTEKELDAAFRKIQKREATIMLRAILLEMLHSDLPWFERK